MKCSNQTMMRGFIAAMLLVMAAAGMAAAGDSITGTIAEKGELIVLDAADGSYVLESSDMTPEMIGKKVNVTGTITEKENMKVINVLTIKEVEK